MGLSDIPTSFGSSFFIRTFFPASLATAIYSFAFYDVLGNSFWFKLGFENKILVLIVISLFIGIFLNIIDLYIYQFYEGIWGWQDTLKNFFYNKQLRKFIRLDSDLKATEKQRQELINSNEKNEVKLWLLTKKSKKISNELRKFPYNPNNNRYLFCWDEFPGNDSIFKDFLRHILDVKWVSSAKIEKLEENMTLKLSYKNHSLLLKLDKEKSKADLIIDDFKADEFIVKKENEKINIYYNCYTQRYPEHPTEFGNVIAEYELYSDKQYGMHMMVFWQHIWLILPKDIRDDIDLRSAKADFNVYVSFILLTFAFIGTVAFSFQSDSWYKILYWNIPKALVSMFLSLIGWYVFYKLSISEHMTYGRYIKAIFDIYRFEVAKKMGIIITKSPDIEKKTWKKWEYFFSDYQIPEK